MSYQERIVQMTTDMPDSIAAVAFFLLKNYLEAAEEAADEEFCMAMENAFEANPDKGELIDFEDACKLLGVQHEDSFLRQHSAQVYK